MCRNIRPLYNFAPPATEDEVRSSAVQFVRKVSGFRNLRRPIRPHLSAPSTRSLPIPGY